MSLAQLYAKYTGSFQQMWARMMIALVRPPPPTRSSYDTRVEGVYTAMNL